MDSEFLQTLMEKNVRNKPVGWFSSLQTYFKGPIESFSIRIGDLVSFRRIAQDVRSKGEEFFSAKIRKQKLTQQVNWEETYPHLKALVDHASKTGRIFDQKLKDFGLFLFLKSGPSAYKFLSKELPLPSIQTVRNELGQIENVVEGEIRVEELSNYLKAHNLPPYIWLSEDATRCISKVSKKKYIRTF